MKNIMALLLLVTFVSCSSSNSQTDFSGSWKLNPEKGIMGHRGPGGPGAPDSTMRPPQPEGAPGAAQAGQRPPRDSGPMGRRGGFMASQLSIKQSNNQLVIERTMKNRQGEDVTTTETYTLDGKECVNESRMGEKTTVCKWSADGKTLSMESLQVFNRDGQSMEMKSVEVLSLDGKSLIIESTVETPRGERKSKTVYDQE
jgi:hypothetical protein